MQLGKGQKVLVTMKEWFVSHNGEQYKAIFGTYKDNLETGRKKIYIEIGNITIEENDTLSIIKTDSVNLERTKDYIADAANGIKEYTRPSIIYYAD